MCIRDRFYSQDTALAFNYTQTTPYKAIASATVLFQQYGFLTADVEFVDYSSMKYNFGQGYENESNDINTVLKNTYKSTVNCRVGAEAKLQDFALRAGVSYYGSPYKNQTVDASTLRISGGVGYRTKNWFLDVSYIYGTQTYQQMPYVLDRANANVQAADIKNTTGNVAVSYTHLDVYKRQAIGCCRACRSCRSSRRRTSASARRSRP